ncbi:MAG: alpha/beta hydrolase, partial [Pseudomonadota bacterium]
SSVTRAPSWRIRALRAALRWVQRPRLERMTDVHPMRVGLERAGALIAPARGARVTEDAAPGPDGGRIPLIWVEPAPLAPAPPTLAAPPAAAILYLHGGGYVAGSERSHLGLISALAAAAGAPALSVGYRLAPEHPLPAALEDAAAAHRALSAARAPGGETPRVALAGDSAGGGLALALAGALEDAGAPAPAALALFSPFTDLALESDSLARNADVECMLPASRLAETAALILGPGGDPYDPRVSPARRRFARTPPPCLIQVGSEEILLDDSLRAAEALRAAGGSVELEVWDRAPHCWQFFPPHLPEARAALARAGAFLSRGFAAAPAA